jgi:hypothetical protein
VRNLTLRLPTLLIAALAVIFAVGSAQAAVAKKPGKPPPAGKKQSTTYQYLVGSGPLCGLPVPSPCPTIAKAPRGDTIEVAGQGTLSVHPKSVTGGGTFTHKGTTGNVIASGTWTATKLLSFKSYGTSSLAALPPGASAGKALIRVRLSAGSMTFKGTLWMFCELPDVPIPAGFHEGIRLSIAGTGLNFNKQVSGVTLFIRQ